MVRGNERQKLDSQRTSQSIGVQQVKGFTRFLNHPQPDDRFAAEHTLAYRFGSNNQLQISELPRRSQIALVLYLQIVQGGYRAQRTASRQNYLNQLNNLPMHPSSARSSQKTAWL